METGHVSCTVLTVGAEDLFLPTVHQILPIGMILPHNQFQRSEHHNNRRRGSK